MSQAEIDVLAERQRQIFVEGWDEAHDEQWSDGQLADAAACYACAYGRFRSTILQVLWPFSRMWWKPKDRRRDLVRAAALIIAEIDRLDRKGCGEEVHDEGK
jgi:hypothetical protein